MLVFGLKAIGIRRLKKSNAGLFWLIDMRFLLSSDTFEGEMKLWKKIIYEVGLNISQGSSCHCTEPDRFRIYFANTSEDTLKFSRQRITKFVESIGRQKVFENKL
ncbi:hypothetical protein M9H77_30167 [Catharanthus roseus]|uniref:Uncharacterized protein n=1 Tax=Catharanthus roseus TaxID=4058 RepID=A0ACB9ZXI9_CATRO|nr:hypothetical protein M9H77_30167 [Catharanthus roseus]